jgi:hypothetical protein
LDSVLVLQDKYNEILDKLKPNLRRKLAAAMIENQLTDDRVLRWAATNEKEFFTTHLACILETELYPAQETIFARESDSDSMFIIEKGLVRCSTKNNVSLFVKGQAFGWEMIRNVCFCEEGEYTYKRPAEAVSFTVTSLSKIGCDNLRNALDSSELNETARKVRAVARWVVFSHEFIKVGAMIIAWKMGAGIARMTKQEIKSAREFYVSKAQSEIAKRTQERGEVQLGPTREDTEAIKFQEDVLKTHTTYGKLLKPLLELKWPRGDFEQVPRCEELAAAAAAEPRLFS